MKKYILIIIAISAIAGLIFIIGNLNATPTQEKILSDGSIMKINGLDELKSNSSTIVQVVGTSNNRKIDYKDIDCMVTKVIVEDVIKGDKNLKEIEILQVAGVDVAPRDGEHLLMFLRDGEDNKGLFVPVGAGQGIYRINITSSENPLNTLDNGYLEPQSIENKYILKDLTGSYASIKNKLKS